MNSDKWIPASNRYRVAGTFRIRIYSADMSDIIGVVTEHTWSHIVETFDEASAIRAAVEQHYWMLENTLKLEYETMGWKAPPSVVFMGVAKPAYRKEAQFSLFDFEPFMKV